MNSSRNVLAQAMALGIAMVLATAPTRGEFPHTCPPMKTVLGGGAGPGYSFEMGQHLVTHAEFEVFLNDAELNTSNDRGAFMLFDVNGNVGLSLGSTEFFDILYSRMTYAPARPVGCRYRVIPPVVGQPGFEDHPVTGVTWIGALKFCNWLTIDQGLAPAERCYQEGSSTSSWQPVSINGVDWSARDLNADERLALLNLRGYRLPMDNSGLAFGWLSAPQNPFNEWYKAAAYDPAAPGTARSGPYGETVSPYHWVYGFGRDSIGTSDANYWASGDPFEPGTTPVGFFDGTVYNPDRTPDEDQVPDPGDFITTADQNAHGLQDLSGNVWEWGQDKGGPGDDVRRVMHGGAWYEWEAGAAAARRVRVTLTAARSDTGFRVVRVGMRTDCQPNGRADDADIAGGWSLDCNTNGVPDECDLDCNQNGVPDGCDIDSADPDGDGFTWADANSNGVPDECELPTLVTEACCAPGGPCHNNTPPGCSFLGGTTQGPGSMCLGDLNANQTDDVCEGITVRDGLDEFLTPPEGATYEFCETPIPADFFGPGSLPFTGKVCLGEGDPDPYDTIMERGPLAFPPGYPSQAITSLKLQCMHVYGCEPILVEYAGGAIERWQVQMLASGQIGTLEATLLQGLEGRFTATFDASARFIFTRMDSPCSQCPGSGYRCNACFDPNCLPSQCVGITGCCPSGTGGCAGGAGSCGSPGVNCCLELDLASCGFPPVVMASSHPAPFKVQAHDNYTPGYPYDDYYEFRPGVRDNGSGVECCDPICHGVGTMPPTEGHEHCVELGNCDKCKKGACCNGLAGCEVVDGPDNCNGEFKGFGTDCTDTDGDAIPDVMEVNDCCLERDETCSVRTSRLLADTDGDGCNDKEEFDAGSDPCDPCDAPPACGSGPTDCNANGIPDACDVICGPDCNANGVLDSCEANGDMDGDGDVDRDDMAAVIACLSGSCPAPSCSPPIYPTGGCCGLADFDGDGDVDLRDFARFQAAYRRP